MKRITTILLAFAGMLAIPGSASGHTDGPGDGLAKWEGNPVSPYSYWVTVCDVGFPDGSYEYRLHDAVNEWNEIGGELYFDYIDTWTDTGCTNNFNGTQNIVRVRSVADLGGDTTGTTWVNCPFDADCSDGDVDDCDLTIDGGGYLTTWGSYTFYTGTASPGETQIDLESLLVHELGHCVSALGHSTESGSYVMNACLNPSDTTAPCSGSPKGIEKDELVSHDRALYSDQYGTTH